MYVALSPPDPPSSLYADTDTRAFLQGRTRRARGRGSRAAPRLGSCITYSVAEITRCRLCCSFPAPRYAAHDPNVRCNEVFSIPFPQTQIRRVPFPPLPLSLSPPRPRLVSPSYPLAILDVYRQALPSAPRQALSLRISHCHTFVVRCVYVPLPLPAPLLRAAPLFSSFSLLLLSVGLPACPHQDVFFCLIRLSSPILSSPHSPCVPLGSPQSATLRWTGPQRCAKCATKL